MISSNGEHMGEEKGLLYRPIQDLAIQALSYFRGFRIQEKERAAGQAGQSHCREDCPDTNPVTLEL